MTAPARGGARVGGAPTDTNLPPLAPGWVSATWTWRCPNPICRAEQFEFDRVCRFSQCRAPRLAGPAAEAFAFRWRRSARLLQRGWRRALERRRAGREVARQQREAAERQRQEKEARRRQKRERRQPEQERQQDVLLEMENVRRQNQERREAEEQRRREAAVALVREAGASGSLGRESRERFARLREARRREERDWNWRPSGRPEPPIYEPLHQYYVTPDLREADVAFLRAALLWAGGRLPWHRGFASGWRRVHAGNHPEPPSLPGADEGSPSRIEWTEDLNLAREVLQDLGHESDDSGEDKFFRNRHAYGW